MLVEINTQAGGGASDQKTRYFNFMASLHAVATAAAGSTPVVNPVNTSAVKDTNSNCITVISNAEGGGWQTGAGNNITASTTFNSSSSTPIMVDLYKSSGKPTYPYLRAGFLQHYAFNSSFTSYPYAMSYCGHSNSDPTTTSITADTITNSASCSGINSTVTNAWQGTTYPQVVYPRVDLDFNSMSGLPHQRIYIASSSNYLIIMTPFDIWYFGTRTVSPWELARTDNPPWVSFGFSTGNNSYPGYYQGTSYPAANHYHAWTSLISPDLTVTSTPRRLGYGSMSGSTGTYGMGLVGLQSNNTYTNLPYNSNMASGLYVATTPLQVMHAGGIGTTTASLGTIVRYDGPVTDVTTGQQVPPAYPLIVNAAQDVSTGNPQTTIQFAHGIMQGILRGPTTTVAGYNAMVTASDYTIGSSTYVPIKIGCGGGGPFDMFFIRKA